MLSLILELKEQPSLPFVSFDKCRIQVRHFRHLNEPVELTTPEVSTAWSRFNRTAGMASALLLPRSGEHMFKISTIETSEERRLIVEGTLTKPWVAELRKTWDEAANALDGRKMVIDLTNATVIDGEGEAAILDLMREGAKFCCSGVLTKHVLKQLAQKCQTTLRCVLEQTRPKDYR